MNTAAPNPSVLEIVLEWSADRPAWQRDALRRIIAGGTPDDAALAELVSLCRKGHGADGIELVATPLASADLPANPGAGESITLLGLGSVIGVNQLAPGQTVPFEPSGITIIYGDNGAGKSGYARVLKRACRARYPGEIMPDAYKPLAGQGAQAEFTYAVAGAASAPATWRDDEKPHPVLSAVSVFDRECGAVHVREKNEVAFRPFGLDIPDELAAICQRVKTVLTTEQDRLTASIDEIFTKKPWGAGTATGKILAALSPRTDIATLETLAVVSDAERERHDRLRDDLARDALVASAEQLLVADQLRQLLQYLRRLAADNADTPLLALHRASLEARTKRAAAAKAADLAYGQAAVKEVGGEVWKELWEAARHYGEHVGTPFPPADDGAVCLLCHEPLSAAARTRLKGFDAFIAADTEQAAAEAEAAFEQLLQDLLGKAVTVGLHADIRRRIALGDKALGKAVLRYMASARQRRAVCLASLDGDTPPALSAFSAPVEAEIASRETRAREYAAELERASEIEGRARLELERDGLADRIALTEWLPKAKAEIVRLKALKLIADCLPDTNTSAITRLGNDIADRVITPSMRDRFQDEIVRLAANMVRVEIVRSGGKYGSPQYQIRLFANAAAKVHNVLSEGEQTCVALAAFLTELATSPHGSALVFDDPVSSLDHRWRRKVAQRLVEEAATRQIIVFTHDLVFVHDLNDGAATHNTPVKLVTLSRGPAGAGMVAIGLPWTAASVKDRCDKLEKDARQSRQSYDARDEAAYRDQAFKIYNALRSTWERAVEDIAFSGVVHRHRDYINTKNLRKATALTGADCDAFELGYKKCCDQTDAHDPSRGRNAAPPPPDEMLKDIQDLVTWANAIRDRQKVIA